LEAKKGAKERTGRNEKEERKGTKNLTHSCPRSLFRDAFLTVNRETAWALMG